MYRPPLCSERESGGYEDCTWASGLMLNNGHHGRADVPSTRTEYEALRVAGGDGPAENPGDGSNQAQAQQGIVRRYGWSPLRLGAPGTRVAFTQVWDQLDPGMGGSIQGLMGAFPRNGHWRRWDPQFGGAHDVYVQRESTADRVWWMDPLATKGYPGEWMTKADFKRYVDGFVGGYLFAKVATPHHAHLRYNARKTSPFPDRTRVWRSDNETLVNVYAKPDHNHTDPIDRVPVGSLYLAYQVTTGTEYQGETKWYGDHHGRRWIHSRRLNHEGGST